MMAMIHLRICLLKHSLGPRQCHNWKYMPVQVVIDIEITREACASKLPLLPRAIYLGLAKIRQTTQAGSMLAQARQL